MSFCEVAISADQSAVSTPTTATTAITPGAETYRWLRRATMYTPAVTIVAAWISAETGVGPAMPPGSQIERGSWALLPVAPMNRQTAASEATPKGSTPRFDWALATVP